VSGAGESGFPTRVGPRPDPWVRVWNRARFGLRGGRQLLELQFDPRYRALAAQYRLPEGSRRVYCHHIRKTAGTSLLLAFLALGGEDPHVVWERMVSGPGLPRTISAEYAFVSFHRRLLAEGHYLFGRAHRPVEEQPLPAATFTVTILRDPMARAHSYYDYLVSGDAEGTPRPVSRHERAMAGDGFDAFLDRVPVRHLLAQLHTFSTGCDIGEAVDRIASCSSVLFTERYAEGLAELATRLDLPLAPHRARVTGTRSTLTEAQSERLRTRLEPEYELLRHLAEGGIGGTGAQAG
jgi:hypothetical protein